MPARPPHGDALRAALADRLGTVPNDLVLFERALTHRSVLRTQPQAPDTSNERLEFLGDALLGFLVAEHLHALFPDEDEGFLTRLRARLVNGEALARAARHVDLGALLRLSENLDEAQGRHNDALLADAFEAVLGALYLDGGADGAALPAARRFVHEALLKRHDLAALGRRRDNYKSVLLEYMQGEGRPQPTYRVVREEGPPHDKTFEVEVLLDGQPSGRGTASSKKRAEQQAAAEALSRLSVGA